MTIPTSTLTTPMPIPAPVFPWRWVRLIVVIAVLCYLPVVLDQRAIFGIRLSNLQLLNIGLTQLNLTLIAILGALSLNYLTGCAGLISIGHGAFYAVGAMAAAVTGTQWGWPFPLVLVAAGVAGAVAGVIAGLPSLRVRGLYFVLSTLALHFIVVFLLAEYQYKFFDVVGIPFNEARIGPIALDSALRWYFFLLPLVAVVYFCLRNTMRSREGRALMAMRDHELAATAAGIDVRILRLKAFAFSSAIAAMAGAVYAYYMTNVTAEFFSINFAIQFIAMIIIGGMGSLAGSVAGAAVWLLLPAVITGFATHAGAGSGEIGQFLLNSKPQLVNLVFGLLVVVLLIFAPGGMAGLGLQLRRRDLAWWRAAWK
ncbi:branched-chain amino acid ABC transporter permease [Glaciimonas sp. GG7]